MGKILFQHQPKCPHMPLLWRGRACHWRLQIHWATGWKQKADAQSRDYCKMQLVACLRSLKVHASPSATKKHVIESCHALFLMCINCGKEHPARVCPHPLRKVAETFTWCSMNLPPNLSSLVLKNATIYSCWLEIITISLVNRVLFYAIASFDDHCELKS